IFRKADRRGLGIGFGQHGRLFLSVDWATTDNATAKIFVLGREKNAKPVQLWFNRFPYDEGPDFQANSVCKEGPVCERIGVETLKLATLTSPEIAALNRETPVVIPIAALEQHGSHLPDFTDSLLVVEVVRRAHEHFRSQILVLPVMWLGNSHHHMDFAGTMSAEPRVYLDLLCGIAQNWIDHGFQRIIFVNGHGGNDVPGRQAIFELRQRFRERENLLLLMATYWTLAEPTTTVEGLTQSAMGHAGEWETSMILRLAPDLVKNHNQVSPVEANDQFAPAAHGWTMPDRSPNGHIGYPADATAEKGEAMLQCFAEGLTSFLWRALNWEPSGDQDCPQ
ncbi:MAG: creatininase family protein, partial [Rubripirellula sp.]|nr:creatininase family protein [Rubripirellula sp.]